MSSSIRVATFNARSFRAGIDVAGRALAPEAPQFVLVQECGPRRRVRRFARAMRLEATSSHRPFGRVRNAILYPAGWRLAALEAHDLTRRGRTLRRGLLAADFRRPGARLTAVSAHLGLAAGERETHARELTDYLAAVHGPVVLGVDLNEEAGGNATRWIADRLFDVWALGGKVGGETFPARGPRARIDYLFVSEGVRVERVWVGEGAAASTASDHRAVLADLTVAEP